MRRNTLIIFTIIALLFIPVFDMNTVSAAENDIANYEYDFKEFEKHLTDMLDEYNSHSPEIIEGKISLLNPTHIIEYLPDDDKYYQKNDRFHIVSPVICDNQVVALVYINEYNSFRTPNTIVPISQIANNNISNGFSFFQVSSFYQGSNPMAYDDWYGMGNYDENIFTISRNNDVKLAYFKAFNTSVTTDDKIRAENQASLMEQKPTYKYISTLYHADSNSKILYSFDYSYNGTSFIKNGGEYYIQNKNGKYLTYTDGKYTLSDNSKTAFIIKRNDDNTFSFSPENAPDKKISVKGTNKFLINLSYFDGYCYSICKSNDHSSYMRAKGDRVAFTKGEPDKVWDASRDWYLVCA